MPSNVYWIDHPGAQGLAIMARPRSGDWLESEIDHWKSEGVGVVVSLLEADEITDLGLEAEEFLCNARGIDFISFPIPDRGAPRDFESVASLARQLSATNKTVAVHCRAGIGRSSLIAASLLLVDGMDPSEAFELIANARGTCVPDTEDQRAWAEAFSAAMRRS